MGIDRFGPRARAALAGAALGVVALLEAWAAVLSERSCEYPLCLPDTELWLAVTAPLVFVVLGRLLLGRAGVERVWSTVYVAGALSVLLLRPLTLVTFDLPHPWLLASPYLAACFAAAAHLCGRSASRLSRLLLAVGLAATVLVAFLAPFPDGSTPVPAPPTTADALPR
ncbi:hypothetical protein ACFY00_13710 [Kitasatospora sp. NPDC001540]|uniref:hypothetical protein n=1 Tax=Kitasatospora sp. NPDC001540 TaxID=3364014 RepID=UPI0036B6A2C7